MTNQPLRFVSLVAAVLLLATGLVAQKTDSAATMLRLAMDTETVDGDLNAAIKQYQAIVLTYGKTDRGAAAQALVRIASCYEKLGGGESRPIYERVVREYADQKEAVAIAQARLGQPVRTEQQQGIALRQVWDGRASGLTAAVLTTVSGDGRRVAYIPSAGPTLNLHDLTTGTNLPLTEADRCSGPPAISRDGTLVAYERYCGAYGSDLRLVNVQGSGVPVSRRLYENADVAQITPMDVSPDKTSIAVMLVRKDRTKQIALVATESGALRVLKSVDWRGSTRIFFSPDGRDLAFDLPANDTSSQRDVFVLAVDGSREVPAVVHPGNDKVMGWSPDGKHLLFASDRRSGAMGLWAQAFADRKPQGTPELITESINSDWSMGVTSSGALYLGLGGAGDQDIAVVSIDLATGKATGPPVRPIQSFLGTNLEPAWSPDGKSLAYVSWRSNNPIFADPRILVIRSVATGETRELRPNLPYFDQMSWAPDGGAFVTGGIDLKGRSWIFRIDARTGDVATIVPLPSGFENSYPQWSPDGKRIYYRVPLKEGASDVAFVERNLASGEEREIARGDLGSINLSPDGRWIAAQRAEPSTQSNAVVIIPVHGGKARELLRVNQGQRILRFSGMPWTPDGGGVLVRKILSGDMRESTSELWLVPASDVPPRKLDIDTNQWKAGNRGVISLSPDGRQIAFLTGQVNSEVWVLENFLPALKAGR